MLHLLRRYHLAQESSCASNRHVQTRQALGVRWLPHLLTAAVTLTTAVVNPRPPPWFCCCNVLRTDCFMGFLLLQ